MASRYRQPFVTDEESENMMSPSPESDDNNTNGGNVNDVTKNHPDTSTTDQAANPSTTNNNEITTDQPPATIHEPTTTAAQEDPARAPNRLTIIFKNQADAETQFKLKNTTTMSKAFEAYHKSTGITPGAYRFFLEGQRVLDTDTPKGLQMVDGDIVEVFTTQLGGGGGEKTLK